MLRLLLIAVCTVLALPVAAIALSWLGFDAEAADLLLHQWQTVLPSYAGQTLLLAIGGAHGTAVLGGGAAGIVTAWEWPGGPAVA
ncbi:MAG: iron ABC transporter permease, partial [Rubrivivax sp.]